MGPGRPGAVGQGVGLTPPRRPPPSPGHPLGTDLLQQRAHLPLHVPGRLPLPQQEREGSAGGLGRHRHRHPGVSWGANGGGWGSPALAVGPGWAVGGGGGFPPSLCHFWGGRGVCIRLGGYGGMVGAVGQPWGWEEEGADLLGVPSPLGGPYPSVVVGQPPSCPHPPTSAPQLQLLPGGRGDLQGVLRRGQRRHPQPAEGGGQRC